MYTQQSNLHSVWGSYVFIRFYEAIDRSDPFSVSGDCGVASPPARKFGRVNFRSLALFNSLEIYCFTVSEHWNIYISWPNLRVGYAIVLSFLFQLGENTYHPPFFIHKIIELLIFHRQPLVQQRIGAVFLKTAPKVRSCFSCSFSDQLFIKFFIRGIVYGMRNFFDSWHRKTPYMLNCNLTIWCFVKLYNRHVHDCHINHFFPCVQMKDMYIKYCANHPRAVEVLTKYRYAS